MERTRDRQGVVPGLDHATACANAQRQADRHNRSYVVYGFGRTWWVARLSDFGEDQPPLAAKIIDPTVKKADR
jgi:hypothetical protein